MTEIILTSNEVSGDIKHLESLNKLSVIELYYTSVYGNIEHLKSLKNLTTICIADDKNLGLSTYQNSDYQDLLTRSVRHSISGDIKHLKSLQNLTNIIFTGPGISGNIIHIKSLRKLIKVSFGRCPNVFGDIKHLKSLPNLIDILFSMSSITGNIIDLKSLVNLKNITLHLTSVKGNLIHLCDPKSKVNFRSFSISGEGFTLDFDHLKSLKYNVDVEHSKKKNEYFVNYKGNINKYFHPPCITIQHINNVCYIDTHFINNNNKAITPDSY